jgi:hypothetical protein
MKRIPEAEIGTLQLSTEEKKATLHCFATSPCILTLDVLNQEGKLYLQHKERLQKGSNAVNIEIHRLKPGKYNAWATMGEVTAIRPITIPPDTSMSGKIHDWIMRLF